MNYTNGVCGLSFIPDKSDLGKWTCEFVIDEKNAQADLGSTTIILLERPLGLLSKTMHYLFKKDITV